MTRMDDDEVSVFTLYFFAARIYHARNQIAEIFTRKLGIIPYGYGLKLLREQMFKPGEEQKTNDENDKGCNESSG